jgi:hypothetical protein
MYATSWLQDLIIDLSDEPGDLRQGDTFNARDL